MRRQVLVVGVLFLTMIAFPVDAAGADRAVEILKQAREAVGELRSLSYQATVMGEGTLAQQRNIIDGLVQVKYGEGGGPNKVFIKGTTIAQSSKVVGFRFANDGQVASNEYDSPKVFRTGGPKDILMRERSELLPEEYLDAGAFADELQSKSVRYEGTRDVEGVACEVLEVIYQTPDLPVARLYFGKDDHLLRRSERPMRARAGGPGLDNDALLVFTVRDLKVNIELDDGKFRLNCPPGYVTRSAVPGRKTVAPRQAKPNLGLLPVGSVAPDWELSSGTGKKISLKSLRGKVVVLDFWATWCGPCRRAMPEVQKLHNRFKDKDVAVFGVNCGERDRRVDPMKFVKDKGYTYGQLLHGEFAARSYRVRGIPTFYVIGKDGKILFATSGINLGGIEGIIEKALKAS